MGYGGEVRWRMKMAAMLATRGSGRDHGGLSVSEWGGCGRRRRRSGALNGKATGGDAVSDDAWHLGGKEWCCGVSGDGGSDCAAEAASRLPVE